MVKCGHIVQKSAWFSTVPKNRQLELNKVCNGIHFVNEIDSLNSGSLDIGISQYIRSKITILHSC